LDKFTSVVNRLWASVCSYDTYGSHKYGIIEALRGWASNGWVGGGGGQVASRVSNRLFTRVLVPESSLLVRVSFIKYPSSSLGEGLGARVP